LGSMHPNAPPVRRRGPRRPVWAWWGKEAVPGGEAGIGGAQGLGDDPGATRRDGRDGGTIGAGRLARRQLVDCGADRGPARFRGVSLCGQAVPGFNPQAAAANMVSTNSKNVITCTLVQYRQMLPMMKSSA